MKLSTVIVLASFALVAFRCTVGQQTGAEIVIEVKDALSQSSAAADHYVGGYHSSVDGETIHYHSPDPDADSALLVRGQNVAPSISWETEPMPDAHSDFAQFIWLAGIECAGFTGEVESHNFDFLINGQRWFTFRNAKDDTAKNWKITGKDGSELTFNAAMTDRAGDLFGYMTLTAPAKDFRPGKSLLLEVRGDNSGSPDWYMTFQHAFNVAPRVRAEPALVRDAGREMQSLRLSLDNLNSGRTLSLRTPTQEIADTPLKIGANVLQIAVPEAKSPETVAIRFKLNGQLMQTDNIQVVPVKRKKIYLLCYSHNDIGYTNLQADVERKQWKNLEEAIQLIHQTVNYPQDARYKWNMETIWALESYLKQASPAQQEEVFADIRGGSIGLSALYANMLTGLANAEEMPHFFAFARHLRSEYQIPMTTAVTSDVPGFSWGLVSAMAQSGVKYFATAPNSGDRIGYTLQAWGDKPFYWASQSGKERVLTWMAGASYSSFHEGSLSQLGDEKIMNLMRKLDESSYPYDMVQLPYTLGDNGGPDPTLADFVQHWNERYVTPRLIIATHEQMFREFEDRYGTTLPVVQGDFTPYWEDGAVSTAYETALNRATADRLIQGETLWSMLAPTAYPASEYEAAWRNVVLFDEHTWGAHNSTEEPDLPFVKRQWETKREFALNADRQSREELEKVLHAPSKKEPSHTAIQVYNTNSWPRTDVVFLSPEESSAGDRVIGPNGKLLRSQRLSTGELAALVDNIPPFSSEELVVTPGNAGRGDSAKVMGNALDNDFLTLSINPQTGAIASLKKNGVELVDAARGGLDEYLYVPGTDSRKAHGISNVHVRAKEQGDLVVSLLVEGDAPGAKHYSSEIRLVEGIDRVDVIADIDKLAVRQKEGVHIAFPFSVPEGQLRYDVADGVVRPEADQLAGACKNFFSVESWVDVSNREYGVTWATANAPLVELGEITAEQPWMKSIKTSSSIYSYVMNNYWHTNYKADQEGPVTFAYSIRPHAAFDATEAVKFGTERRQPLIVSVSGSPGPLHLPLMELSSTKIIVFSVKPVAAANRWLVHVYNPTAADQMAGLRWKDGKRVSIRRSDAAGGSGNSVRNFELAAFDSAYFLISQE
ncbi:MAG: glycoside hydrolase family 38 C-terminal domain-containing protein [Candidatus Sulfotelmatobacter sp.]